MLTLVHEVHDWNLVCFLTLWTTTAVRTSAERSQLLTWPPEISSISEPDRMHVRVDRTNRR